MIRLIALLGVLCVTIFGSSVGSLAQSRLSGEPGRVVVLDSSGSMVRDFNDRSGSSRWDQAKAVIEEIGKQLADRGDRVPTALMVFGDRGVWADVSARYPNGPQSYPASGALCSDVATLMDFGPMTQQRARAMNQAARAASPSGMTPIPFALNTAMDMLDPQFGGTIILVSDMDSPNCLDGQDLCSAIRDRLNRFQSEGGDMRIEFRVAATPQATFTQELAACAPSVTESVDPADPRPDEVVRRLLGSFSVNVVLEADAPGNIDPTGFLNSGVDIRVINPLSGAEVSSGQPGLLPMIAGSYIFVATTPFGAWDTSATVSGPTTVTIPVPGSTLTVEAEGASGNPMSRLAEVSIGRPGETPIWRQTNVVLPLPVSLGTGPYEVRGRATSVGVASLSVDVPFDGTASALLDFGRGVQQVAPPLTINVVVGRPTLSVPNITFDPTITLSGGDLTARRVLSAGSTSLTVSPGQYQVVVGAATPHVIDFTLDAGQAAHEVTILVPPGRFVAEAAIPGGQFELQDRNGTPLFSFDAPLIEHSLPDGTYTLVYRYRDGTISPAQRLDIVVGEVARRRF